MMDEMYDVVLDRQMDTKKWIGDARETVMDGTNKRTEIDNDETII